jgi:A/G-specific adenine glycosylase
MNAILLHQAVADWWAHGARDLPWRRPPYQGNAYAVLVSEVMLQQTQVDRVVPKFIEFMETFPTIEALAEAAPADVIRVWAGMGYNGRAARLNRLARIVVSELDGDLPQTAEGLRALPGIGPYTAAAVACFAFGSREPVLDTNVYRVLSRVAHAVQAPPRKEIDPLARDLVPADAAPIDPSAWHQGLMDIGATICTAARPQCMLCPLRALCAAAPVLQAGSAREAAEASVPYVAKQSRFAGSSRFYRGRVVEALRALAPGEHVTLAELSTLVGGEDAVHQERGPQWLEALVDGLVRDGLAVRRGERIALP